MSTSPSNTLSFVWTSEPDDTIGFSLSKIKNPECEMKVEIFDFEQGAAKYPAYKVHPPPCWTWEDVFPMVKGACKVFTFDGLLTIDELAKFEDDDWKNVPYSVQ